ncbi:FtsX-like permease family protein [Kytococcus sedentarius]|uniref:FtsX-like permease family protein n=1 Tax=Kytococcus sedentarius TaxID=1276 RepID=UPI0038509ED7
MITLGHVVRRDLWFNRNTWLWTLVSLTACSTCISTVFVSASTVAESIAQEGSAAMALELQSLVSVLMSFIGLTACAVIATSTRLVVVTQSRTHALWKILGMPSRTVRRVVLAQVCALALIASTISCLLAPLASLLYVRTWAETGLPVTGGLGYSPTIPVNTLAITTLFALAGAWSPARAAAQTDELQALREAEVPTSRVTRLAWITSLCLLGMAALCFFAGVEDGINADGEPDAVVAAMLMLLAAALTVPAWTIRATLAGWTMLLRAPGLPWHLARAAVTRRTAQSVSASLPYALVISLIGTLYGAVSAAGVEANGVGMLLGLILPICVAGGMGTVAMAGPQRRHDARTLTLMGASTRDIHAANAREGLSYGITGVLFGWAFTLGTSIATSLLLDIPVLEGLRRLPWGLLLALTLSSLAAPTITAAATGHPVPTEERA